MMRTNIVLLAGVAMAAALSPASSQARPRASSYYAPEQTGQRYAQPVQRSAVQDPAVRANAGVRWNIPFQQWSAEIEEPARQGYQRAQTQQGWYVPAPDGSVRTYASYGNQGQAGYYDPSNPDAYYQTAPQPEPSKRAGRVMDPRYKKQMVAYDGTEQAGTIVIDTNNKFLYLVVEGGQALRYGIGVGRPGFEWSGIKSITRKAEWPDWTPPDEMLKRRPELPRFMAGGPSNPLGARAMYLGSSLYRIHGTNEPNTIGTAVSSGCIRMVNDDVIDLYSRVRLGTRVIVI